MSDPWYRDRNALVLRGYLPWLARLFRQRERGDGAGVQLGGAGRLPARIAARFPDARLAGLDPVPAMLAGAREKLSPAVDLRTGYANELPWPDGSFDIVLSCNVFHYIQHPLVAVSEMERVLRPGGQMVITDWCDDYLACRICNVYLRLTRRSFFKTYRQSECQSLLEKAGQHPSIERYKINWLWGMMTATARTA